MILAVAEPALAAHPEPRQSKRQIPANTTGRKPMQHEESANASGYSHWSAVVERIKQNDPAAMEELYVNFSRGVRFYLCRQLGPQEIDDKIHDTFLIVVQAIQRGELREPERVMGFVRTVVRRQVAAHIDRAVTTRRETVEVETAPNLFDLARSPEERAIAGQRVEIMREVLEELSDRDREILTRFYVKEQSQNEICRDMGLTETQFRLLKSRAKARFGEIGKRLLAQRNLSNMVKAAGAE
jgi:RNA polymerase sigma-70 factor (ECF subfamily)